MKKRKKQLLIIFMLVFMLFVSSGKMVYAQNMADLIERVEYSEDFKNWLELSEEEKEKVQMPRMYNVESFTNKSTSPLYIAKMLKAGINSKYSLKDVIPSNLSIRNQKQTNSCWAFASLSSLETNLALSNYKKGINTSKVYDFSERHMEYATSQSFLNNSNNPIGYNRKVGSGGSYQISDAYLTNGTGAILESEMPFENNENDIDINQIKNKTVASQVYDTVIFPDYRYETDEKKTEIMNQIKQHIQNYGSVNTAIHGNSSSLSAFNCYDNDTGAKYCNSSFMHKPDHAVSIVGWDDNYSIDKFPEAARPKANGAWIARNSWGERIEFNLSELKEEIFNTYKQQCIAKGWNSANEIPNEFIEQAGYTVENDIAYIKYGDNGYIYISYEDVNVSKQMSGIEKATDTVNYDYIYQYDEFYPGMQLRMNGSKMMLANIFNKKTSGSEYLTQVSLYAPETYTCRVYVNPNGTSKAKNDLQLIQLKAGETETFNAGYHTLEFSKPVEIKGNSFVVVVEIQSAKYSATLPLESTVEGAEAWNSVKVESGKCFVALGNDLSSSEWIDLSKMTEVNSSLVNGDSTIKAYTTTELIDESLKNIEIVTPPSKTSYFEGENFDKTGMIVKANYNSKTNPSVVLDNSSYGITNGSNLQAGQTSVTITYEDKSVQQQISVGKNTVTKLEITTPPTKTEYREGYNFENAGMIVKATFKDGTTKEITDYKIENGNGLKVDQTEITISYGEKTVSHPITVIPNPLTEIKITTPPKKINYVVGQDFDKTGMVIKAVYEDGLENEITDYTIENGTSLTKDQTQITIKYEDKTITQDITVVEKSITEITVDKMPTKIKYIQNKENLDLTGGTIKALYNDGTSETVSMTSDKVSVKGFDNSNIGKIKVSVTYMQKEVEFEIEIIEEEKAKNSNLSNSKCDVKNVKAYYFTDNKNKEYTLINVDITNIQRNLSNDSIEYYYYLSTNQNEKNINDWIKITEEQKSNDKLSFTIDSRKVANYDELAGENVIYLYIKEVAIKGGNQSINISNAMKLESNITVETYVDNAKKENLQSGNQTSNNSTDDTKAPGKLPQAGVNTVVLSILGIVSAIGIFLYSRYKNLSKYIK